MDVDLRNKIDEYVKKNDVFLFMKGTPDVPMCGFSAQAAAILKEHAVTFESLNVLDHEDIRQGIKVYSDWPTIPQLYVKGEFVGGCDIMIEMHESGELEKVLKS